MYTGFWQGFAMVFEPVTFLSLIGGTIFGIIIGALPGLGASAGMALMLPIIYFWNPVTGLVFLTSLWMADNYGGSISSILLGIPGGAGAVFTCLDGYPMAKQGKGATAIGISMGSSAVAGVIGALGFMLAAPPMAAFVLKFGPAEYFLLAIFGLTIISYVCGGNIFKGLISGCLGLTLSFVGMDLITGYPRFSFHTAYLLSELEIQVLILGLFAIGHLVSGGAEIREQGSPAKALKAGGSVWEGCKLNFKYPRTLFVGSFLGLLIGALPGTGVGTATALSYQYSVSTSKHPETFGKGEPEGVVGPEAANNSVQGGALIPSLTMGIPGSIGAAVFLGGLAMYGIAPGGDIFVRQGPLVWSIFWAMIVSIIAFMCFGLIFNRSFSWFATLPYKFLAPAVFAMIIGGAFAANNNPVDIIVTLIFGVVAFLMEATGLPSVPLILGFIMGGMAEENYFRALILSSGSHKIFFSSIIDLVLWILIILLLTSGIRRILTDGRRVTKVEKFLVDAD